MSEIDYNVQVSAEAVFVPERSDAENDRYFFAYTITIRNAGSMPAKLITRHWIITDGTGAEQEVRGDGVVGEQPHMSPGQGFQYTSAAVIETPVGSMHGSYQMVADDGTEFDATISPFRLAVPSSLH